MGPTWLADLLASVMLLTAAYCVARIAFAGLWGRTTHVDVDTAHVAMGLAMAGMFVPALAFLPSSAWEILFAAMAVLFAVQVVYFLRHSGLREWDEDHLHHVSHYATHLAMAVAMIYMLAAFPAGASSASGAVGMATMAASSRSGSGVPFILAFVLLVAAVWYADSLTRFTRRQPAMAAGEAEGIVSAVPEADTADALAGPVEMPAPSAAGQAVAGAVALQARPRLVGATVLSARDGRWLAPRLEVTTHIVMCFAMGYMLIVMR